jgi:hypothetical protein
MKQLRESIATLLHHYYYGPEYYDVGPADIKVSRRQGESMKNYQGMSDRKLVGLAERLVEDYDPDDPENIYDIGTKPKDDGQGVLPTNGVVVNNYAATDKPDWGISDWGKSGTGSEDEEADIPDYDSAEDNRDELDLDSANDESDELAKDNAHSPATTTRHLPAFVWLGSAIESLMELIVKSEYFGAVDLVPEMREMQFKLQGAQDRHSTGAPAGGYEITSAKADKLVDELRQRIASYPDEGLKRILTHELDKLETAFDVLTNA